MQAEERNDRAFNVNDLTPEQIQKGMACKSLDDFKAYVKGEGFDLDEKETQAIFEEMYATELSDEELEAVAGGSEWCKENVCDNYNGSSKRK